MKPREGDIGSSLEAREVPPQGFALPRMNDDKRVRLDDIAALAGVTKMTVSLALRGERRVSARTKARILAIAADLGYTPDPALSALNAYRRSKAPPRFAGTIAFINTFDKPLAETPRRYYVRYYQGAVARGRELGFKVEEFWLGEPGMNARGLDRILKSRGVPAVIVGPLSALHTTIPIDWSAYSAVALGLSLEEPRLHAVANNHFQSALLCVERLHALGRRRIGLCLQQAQNERVQFRWSGGYLAACDALIPRKLRLQPLLYSTPAPADLQRWIAREKPDAIITGEPGLVDQLQSEGWSVPDDIAVAMPYEDTGHEERPLACIDENAALNGATAVDLVAGMVYRNERGVPGRPLQVLVPGEWRSGWSAPVA